MNNIDYETSMMKYMVTELFMSDLALLMLKNLTLKKTTKELSKKHDLSHLSESPEKQIYVLASSLANSVMGEEMSVLCPKMFADRQRIRRSEAKTAKASVSYSQQKVNFLDIDLETLLEEVEEEMSLKEISIS